MYKMSQKPEKRKIRKKKEQEKQNQNQWTRMERNIYTDSFNYGIHQSRSLKNQVIDIRPTSVVQLQREFIPINIQNFPRIMDLAIPVSGVKEEQPEWYKKLGKYQYVSENNGIVGSLYFENGRIRLLHADGPAIEISKKQRYLISPELQKETKNNIASNILTFYDDVEYKEKRLSEKSNKEDGKKRLEEFHAKLAKEDIDTIKGMNKSWHLFEMTSRGNSEHMSRGTASGLRFTPEEMETLYWAVSNCIVKGGNPIEQNKELAKALKGFWSMFCWDNNYLYMMTKDKEYQHPSIPWFMECFNNPNSENETNTGSHMINKVPEV